MLRLGVIGCGRVTSMFHMKAIEQVDEITVTALSDVSEERMKEIQKSCNASGAYTDYRDLLADPAVEAVAVNTPPRFHEVIVLDALESGKHVLCEKPLAETVEGCIKIKELQDETGLTVLPAHNYAFTPSLAKIVSYVDDGSIGHVTDVRVSFENLLKSYRSQTDFRENIGNGVVEDVLPHVLSVVYPIVGHIDEVGSLDWWCKDYEVCDNMDVKLVSKTGIPVAASMSWTKLIPRFSLTINGMKGSLYSDLMMDPYKVELTTGGKTSTWKEKGISWYLDLVKFRHPSFRNQYRHFYDLIKNGGAPLITLDDEINILETMDRVSGKMR